MEKKYYLSDLFNEKNYQLKQDELNLIVSPCGSGKTRFITTEYLQSNKNIVYVSNTVNLKNQTMIEHSHFIAKQLGIEPSKVLVEKQSEYGTYLTWSTEVYHHQLFDSNQVIFMTYSSLVNRLTNQDLCFNKYQQEVNKAFNKEVTIILDELHDLYNYMEQFDNTDYAVIDEWLSDEETYQNFTILGLTATPDNISLNYHDVLGKDKEMLKSYTQNQVLNYSEHLQELLPKLNINEKNKAIVFCSGSIKSLYELTDELKQQGLNVECLWSKNNKDFPYTDKQQQVYEELITNSNISLVDILILNSAFESGINIQDLDVNIIIYNYKVSHQTETKRIQCIGRVRHSVDLLLLRTNKKEVKKEDKDKLNQLQLNQKRIELLNGLIEVKLTTEDFKQVCEMLDYKTEGRKLIKTTKSLNPLLLELGFVINDKRDKNERYKVINKL